MIKWGTAILVLGALLWSWLHWSQAPVLHDPGTLIRQDPEQIPLAGEHPAIPIQGWTLKPLAGFTLTARILSIARYSGDPTASLSPFDLALGWGPMSDTAVIEKLDISQSNRFYHWRYWGTSPIPEAEITRHSANMHLIPADDTVRDRLTGLRVGSTVKISGYLVEATHPSASHPWRSSLTRDDAGPGSCEIIYVKFAQEAGGR